MNASSKLQQINARYINTEDRILLRTSTSNNEEYLLWLTRRYTGLLLNSLTDAIEARGGTTSISNQSRTKALFKQGAFEKPYTEATAPVRPLGDNGVLAYALKTGSDQDGNLRLEIQSQEGKGISYHLDDALLYMLFSLLSQCVQLADWKLDSVDSGPGSGCLH